MATSGESQSESQLQWQVNWKALFILTLDLTSIRIFYKLQQAIYKLLHFIFAGHRLYSIFFTEKQL
jgi:hypothetical protein